MGKKLWKPEIIDKFIFLMSLRNHLNDHHRKLNIESSANKCYFSISIFVAEDCCAELTRRVCELWITDFNKVFL